MEFSYFDLIVGSIVLLLGLKGILNGFFKEVFGLIGIVGGVFAASRFANPVGSYVSDLVFHFDNEAAVNFTGFLIVLGVFWGGMIALGAVFRKLSSLSGLGPLDRILGFVFGAGKFFFIVSMIVYAVYNIKAIRQNIEKPLRHSVLFPIMVETGAFIMKIDPIEHTEAIEKTRQNVEEHITRSIEKQVTQTIENKLNDTIRQSQSNNSTVTTED